MTNLERIRKELSPARRKKVAARAAQLIAEEMTLQELRRARRLTQVRMAKELGIRSGRPVLHCRGRAAPQADRQEALSSTHISGPFSLGGT